MNGYKIGIFHGHGEKKITPERAYERFSDKDVDIIIFGHSHQPGVFTKNGVLMLNPGSPFKKRREKLFSYMILDLAEEQLNIKLNFF